jgi:hypothetical protein
MNRTLEKPFKKSNQPFGRSAYHSQLELISSYEEIPDFDNPIAEKLYWKTHCPSKELLDQVPEIEESEE